MVETGPTSGGLSDRMRGERGESSSEVVPSRIELTRSYRVRKVEEEYRSRKKEEWMEPGRKGVAT